MDIGSRSENLLKILEESESKMVESVKKQLEELSEIVGETIDKDAAQEKRKAVIEGKRQALEFYKELTQWLRDRFGVNNTKEVYDSPVEKRVRMK